MPARRYDTSYLETRQVAWDGYVEVRGNRYSVPAELAGQAVTVRIGLDESLRVYAGERLVATHTLQNARKGWVTISEHHAALWEKTLGVERRPLDVYEEAATWN